MDYNVRILNLIRYTCWYDPQFSLRDADYSHAQVDARLEDTIRKLAEDIAENGLRNPVFVTCKHTKWIIHPGKCRTKALLSLGIEHAPAIVVNYDLPGFQHQYIPDGCRALCSQSQVNSHLDKDQRAKMCHRFLTVKAVQRANLDKPYI